MLPILADLAHSGTGVPVCPDELVELLLGEIVLVGSEGAGEISEGDRVVAVHVRDDRHEAVARVRVEAELGGTVHLTGAHDTVRDGILAGALRECLLGLVPTGGIHQVAEDVLLLLVGRFLPFSRFFLLLGDRVRLLLGRGAVVGATGERNAENKRDEGDCDDSSRASHQLLQTGAR